MNTLLDVAEIGETPDVEAYTAPAFKLPEIDNAATLLSDESIQTPPEIIIGLLHEGLKAVLAAGSKDRKTWILLHIAIAVSAGIPFWKWPTRKGNVLYINFEIPRAFIRSRIKTLCCHLDVEDVSNLDVWTLRGHGMAFGKLLPELLAKIEAGKYTLLIIDPIYKGLGGRDENKAGDIAELLNELEQLAVKTGAAILYASHYSKGNQASKEAMDRISGSGVWARDADTLIMLTKHEVEGAYTVDTVLRNLPEKPSFVVAWKFPTMIEQPDLDPEQLKKPKGGRDPKYDPLKLLAFIKGRTSANPISATDWAAAANMKRSTLNGYLPGIRAKGWIVTVGDGNKARQALTEKGCRALEASE